MVRIRETAWTPAERTEADPDLPDRAAALAELLRGRRAVVLTGAGISTPSGIPDYRGPDSPGRTPMTFQQFVGDPTYRRHYWARNHLGWRHMEAARPNAAHLLLADWERRGLITGVITQNVDLLHLKAGNRRLVDLHGTYAVVICLDCGLRQSRWSSGRSNPAEPSQSRHANSSESEIPIRRCSGVSTRNSPPRDQNA